MRPTVLTVPRQPLPPRTTTTHRVDELRLLLPRASHRAGGAAGLPGVLPPARLCADPSAARAPQARSQVTAAAGEASIAKASSTAVVLARAASLAILSLRVSALVLRSTSERTVGKRAKLCTRVFAQRVCVNNSLSAALKCAAQGRLWAKLASGKTCETGARPACRRELERRRSSRRRTHSARAVWYQQAGAAAPAIF